MSKETKYQGRKCILRAAHKSSAHYGRSHLDRHLGIVHTVGESFHWAPDLACFVGDLIPENKDIIPLYGRFYITWIKE